MERPTTTLFLLTSVDGKISTGACDELDIDRDLPLIPGVREGLHQYYEIEQTTDLWSLNSGRVMAKIGANVREMPEKSPVSFVIIDNSHLTEHGVRFMCAWAKNFVLVTTNPSHPAFSVNIENLHVIKQDTLSLSAMLEELYAEFDCDRITLQSGGTLNSLFLREGLIDFVDIVMAPLLIGGKDTSSLVDGKSFMTREELSGLGVLKLQECIVLENSYLRLRYEVINK